MPVGVLLAVRVTDGLSVGVSLPVGNRPRFGLQEGKLIVENEAPMIHR